MFFISAKFTRVFIGSLPGNMNSSGMLLEEFEKDYWMENWGGWVYFSPSSVAMKSCIARVNLSGRSTLSTQSLYMGVAEMNGSGSLIEWAFWSIMIYLQTYSTAWKLSGSCENFLDSFMIYCTLNQVNCGIQSRKGFSGAFSDSSWRGCTRNENSAPSRCFFCSMILTCMMKENRILSFSKRPLHT